MEPAAKLLLLCLPLLVGVATAIAGRVSTPVLAAVAANTRTILQTPTGSAPIPRSPFGQPAEICSSGGAYSVRGFPGSPFQTTPFVNVFKNPPVLPPTAKGYRADGHGLFEYELDIMEFQARLFDNVAPACRANPPTWFMGYGGISPGPTIVVPTGHEALVRFNNKVAGAYHKLGHEPCVGGRQGRPFSTHFHGSNSLPPYDGWATDEICGGESKDYILPNQRSTTGWYHDHALHITADNAYAGVAGFYLMSASRSVGGCGEPWNIENMEERHLMFQDKVLDNKCQLYFNHSGPHQDNLYGDINLVSGIPWPRMPLEPKWYRFRMLNAAATRPFLIMIKNQAGANIHQDICHIVATDGGYLEASRKVVAAGVLMGAAERYDMVCDFSRFANQQLYLTNGRNENFMKDVPMFCYSHLLARLEIGGVANAPKPIFNPTAAANKPGRPMARVFSVDDYQRAVARANDKKAHREFVFGHSNGHWVINGETWDSFTFAATDVGQNTWELWELKTGGGWFHPIHMHLVDFFVLTRDRDGGLQPYERLAPKDVVYLGPSQDIFVVARFGAHRGDFMFHCHNLVHEDNDMMRAMRIVSGSQGRNKGTQFINNQAADVIYSNWDYNNPLFGETSARPTDTWPLLGPQHAADTVNKNLYRIFYPNSTDPVANAANNPWAVSWCPAA
eukprot:jgi/Chrzof1/6255/Cz17g17180.t1